MTAADISQADIITRIREGASVYGKEWYADLAILSAKLVAEDFEHERHEAVPSIEQWGRGA